jgi:hypothetical protein
MTWVTQVRIYIAPRRRDYVKGVAYTIKLTPLYEIPKDKWRPAMGRVFVETGIANEVYTDRV